MMTTAKQHTTRTPAVASATQTSALLNDKQVMDFLGVSRVKLHYMMRKDGLPYIKLGEGRGARCASHGTRLTSGLYSRSTGPVRSSPQRREEFR